MPETRFEKTFLSRFILLVYHILEAIIDVFLHICMGIYYIFLYVLILPLKRVFKHGNKKVSKRTINSYSKISDNIGKEIDDYNIKYKTLKPFRYKVSDSDGNTFSNTFFAYSRKDVYDFLTGEEYFVLSLKTSKLIEFVFGESKYIYNKFRTRDLIFLTTEIKTYTKAGMTLTDAVRLLAKEETRNKYKQRVLLSILYYLNIGEPLSSALSHQNNSFPSLYINMIKSSEATGNIEEALDSLESYYIKLNKIHKDMINAISYPIIILLFAILVIFVVIRFIVPRFSLIYLSAGAELSSWTKFIVNLSNFLKDYSSLILLIIMGLVFINYILYKKVRGFRYAVQVILLRLPLIGKIIKYNELTIFTKTFSALLRNDVYITDSMNILENLTNNEIYKSIIRKTINNIAKGEKISKAFKNHFAVPPMVYHMIITGENTGEMDTMMEKVSEYTSEEHSVLVHSLETLIEPILIIILAFVIGAVMLAVIMPMFDLYNAIIS